MVFDRDGFQQPIFENANFVDGGGSVFKFSGPRVAVALNIPYSIDERRVRLVMHVVPVEPVSRPILTIAFEDKDESNATIEPHNWTWRLAPDGEGKPPRIEIGTYARLAEGIPAAVYRWSPAANRYEGPERGRGFRRIPLEAARDIEAYLKKFE